MGIKIFTGKHCGPCDDIMEILKSRGGVVDGEHVEVVDIETDEGFKQFKEEVLEKGDGAVPSAYKEGKRCKILITEDNDLTLNCLGETPDSSSEQD